MPAYAYPASTCDDDNCVNHVEAQHGCAANACQAGQVRARGIPGKVLAPPLGARMEEGHGVAGQGIAGSRGAALALIAAPASNTEIVKDRHAALHLGNNVFDRHGLSGVRFSRMAIGAPLVISGGLPGPLVIAG
jgi:hypothetical protein